MKIFIGGHATHHQHRFKLWFPEIEFVFASLQDGENKWETRSANADIVIIDQSRCNHRIVDRVRAGTRGRVYIADGKAQIRKLIEEIVRGETGHRYTGTTGSETVAWSSTFANHFGQCELPPWLEEVEAGGAERRSVGEGEER